MNIVVSSSSGLKACWVENQRRRDRSRSRDSNRRAGERRRRRIGGSGGSSSPCRCAHCGPWQQDCYRDLSIRYPGMTQQSFDEMVAMLDEVVNEINEDDGLLRSSLEVLNEPVHIPSSPTELQPIVETSEAESRNRSCQRGGDAFSIDNFPVPEQDGLRSRLPDEPDEIGCRIEVTR